jgi:tetratricopeptide (TPR) repeat protein
VTNLHSDPLVGRTIGQYQILARVGGGGMGVVYTARDTRLTRIVALKFLPPQWSHDASAKERFVREAQTASATNHPNICTVHDIETAEDGQLFIVMAYYEGQTLKTRLESGPLPIEQALDIAMQVADGLAKAHAQGVVHRDIKPGNLILTEDGVRILDFGLATFVDALKLTAENAALGTVAYMSPEQVRGQQADARTDVWATGAVLYEMLTGHPPFCGSHAEAIGYAVRNEQPTPIREERPEVPEEVEQLVFRALHKEPGVRFASGRELARALRHVRGLSVPLDLRTKPVPVSEAMTVPPPRRVRWTRWAAAAALVVAATMIVWLGGPADRVAVAIAPTVNAAGEPSLDGYLLALTEELADQLDDVEGIRVLPHAELLRIVRQFRQPGRDVTSRETLQAIARRSGARVLIVPRIRYSDGGWSMQAAFRNPDTGTDQGTVETAPEKSALSKDVVYRHVVHLREDIATHFAATRPIKASLAATVRRWTRRAATAALPRFRTLDAAAAFEHGVDAYERLELAEAFSAFGDASTLDPRNPLPLAWRSRMATLMRQDLDAREAGDRAASLLANDIRPRDRVLVEAIAAEARHDVATAGSRYRELAERYPDEPTALLELAAFQDRQNAARDAIETYHRALGRDPQLLTARLELCRLYAPTRTNEPVLGKEQGQAALRLASELQNSGAEAQAFMCLTDVLRSGSTDERREARRNAEQALSIMERLRYPFGIARASNYVAIVALLAERDAARAVPLLERTLKAARDVGFVRLEVRVLMNLGVAHEALARRSVALQHYRASFELAEKIGEQQDAAANQINAAQILVDNGPNPDEGLRNAQNALGVFERLEDKDFEANARRVIGAYYRHSGEFDRAARELNIGLTVARERDLVEKVTRLTTELARVRFDAGDYLQARELLTEAERNATGLDAVHARIELGRTYTRLGAFDQARDHLNRAGSELERFGDVGSLPLLNEARGELAYESGDNAGALSSFARASDAWSTDDWPEDASVEARAYLGWLQASSGKAAKGKDTTLQSLRRARQTRRADLEGRCVLFLARIALATGNAREALLTLNELSDDRRLALSADLQAQIHFWQGRALAHTGDAATAAAQLTVARDLVERWQQSLRSSPYAAGVLQRRDIRLITRDNTATRP